MTASSLPIPETRLLWLLALWLLLGIAAVPWPKALPGWQAWGAAALALAVADGYAGRRRRGRLTVTRKLARTLPVGSWQTIGLKLSASGPVAGWLRDRHPATFRTSGLPLFFDLAAGQWMETSYRLHLTTRGAETFSAIDLRVRSPLGLWSTPETLPVADTARIFPDFARIAHYTLLATDHRLSQWGILNRRRRGEGMEFHQLRDYRREDSPRQIDWKASARLGKLISREFQDQRDQQVVFLLDCGSRMGTKDGDLSHFDHTLNALLLLAYVALNQGDAVGMLTFGHASPRYIPPRKSVATVNRLLNAVYDLQPTHQAPDYLLASQHLLRRLGKRALVIVLTNLRDEDADTLQPAAALLARRHAVTIANLRESILDDLLEAPVADFDSALTRAAALQVSADRQRQAAHLRHGGIPLLDVSPDAMPITLINHYWERKRSGSL